MTDPTGHQCPECGAPRGADSTPSCGCTRRASDALRDARTAEQAAAEDFDPLRIRPYVELEHDEAGHSATPAATPAVAPAEATMPLRAVSPETPSPADLRLFEGAGPEATYAGADEAAKRPRGRRRTVLLGAGGAVVAVVAAAGLASGLFSYEKPSRDHALPDVRASVPDASTSPASEPSPENATSARQSAPSSGTPTPTGSTSPSLSAPPSPASSSPSPSGSPSPKATATASLGPSDRQSTAAPVLRPGSQGAEVTELELRLTQLGLYTRKAQGYYDKWVESAVSRYQWARGIQDDEQGVYGAETRSHLESETREP
ncbi:peptidoglycan-binding domain-containing protein [Streptomyces sp. NPDC048419]|uniref:peptidoglycan-binding domain-containing protein n=1 Tax=Streptomyces sp. NPDC048419 TaxID=3365547 RepID=UPI00371B4241